MEEKLLYVILFQDLDVYKRQGEDGGSHESIEDIALMRSIPGMIVLSPADAVETKKMIFAAAEYEGPVYIRMGRLDVETIFDEETYDFQIGIANTVKEGNDVTIAATGLMTYEAIKAADILAQEGISVRVINVGTIKPLEMCIRDSCKSF